MTRDALFDGKLTVCQEKEGYRFSLDALLLAGLTAFRAQDRIVELGTGCGVVLLVLAYRGLGRELLGLEIQPELAALARANCEHNGFGDRIEIRELDYREVASVLPAQGFDLVLANPPYRPVGTGRLNPSHKRALARHELSGSVADVFVAASHLLRHGGSAAVVYPAGRLAHLMTTATASGFSPKRLTLIHSNRSGPARLLHLECRKGGGEELRIDPPFFIYREDGSYTDAMRRLQEG